jgi:hypothetical protein
MRGCLSVKVLLRHVFQIASRIHRVFGIVGALDSNVLPDEWSSRRSINWKGWRVAHGSVDTTMRP